MIWLSALCAWPGSLIPRVASDPSDVAHRRIKTLDVELILQADRKAMERAEGSLVVGVVGVEGSCELKGSVKEDFVEAVILFSTRASDTLPGQTGQRIQQDVQSGVR